MARTKTKPTTTEPEEIGPADVAPAPKPKKSAPIAYLDAVNSYLKQLGREEDQAEEIIRDVFGESDQAMPARMLAFLRDAKADGRFVIEKRGDKTFVSLASAQNPAQPVTATADPMDEGPSEPATKTIGEQLAAVQAQPKFPYPVVVGMPVILKTEGSADATAKILAVHDHGASFTYKLSLESGEIDDVPAFRLAPHPEAEALYANREMRLACLERHQAKLHEIAQKYFDMQAQEDRVAGELKAIRARIEGLATEMAEHGRSDAIQTELNDIIGDGSVKQEDGRSELQKRIAEGDATTDGSVDVDELLTAALSSTDSTGKPPKVVPFPYNGEEYVLVDVQHGSAVLLPLFNRDEWTESYGDGYGEPRKLPSDDQSVEQARGGKHCGMPVKVGRATLWIGGETDALLLRVPPTCAMPGAEPELAMSGKDAAAGE